MKHSLLISFPNLPDDKKNVLVELENGITTGAIYTAKIWSKPEDLQSSFKPIGIETNEKCGTESCYVEPGFNSKIINWWYA